MNRTTWGKLKEHGVMEESELRLDFFYVAESLSNAERLAAFLRAETDYEVTARANAVTGTTQATTLSLAISDEWVKWMTLAGWENGRCEFDGWGAEVP